jgi:hypothetical protein
MYNGIRHFVFLTPPLAALGGYAAAQVFDRLHRRPRAQKVCAGIFLLGVALVIYDFGRLHPYQYTYFNRMAGGVRAADRSYMLDYWGLSFKQASEKLLTELHRGNQSTSSGGRWRIAVCGPHSAAQVALGDSFELTWDPAGADFAMMLGEFYCAQFNAPVMAEVERDGVVYTRVYDIRGRSFKSLFTIPPVQ